MYLDFSAGCFPDAVIILANCKYSDMARRNFCSSNQTRRWNSEERKNSIY